MSLALAEAELARDPGAAKALLGEARDTTSGALAELRALVRGVHPPVLAESGPGRGRPRPRRPSSGRRRGGCAVATAELHRQGPARGYKARTQVPGLPVLVLSQYVEQHYARELLADGSGGVGYLLKDRVVNVEQFLDAYLNG